MLTMLRWVGAGFLATTTMDVGAALLRATGATQGLSPQFIGRWFAGLVRGQIVHHTILEQPPVPGEMAIALFGHYLIGMTLAIAFGTATSLFAAERAALPFGLTVAMATIFGVATCVLPWLIMFPSMGFGAYGVAGPAQLLLARTSLFNHVVFGAALGLFAHLLGATR